MSTYLSKRDCASILGSLIAGLVENSDVGAVRDAVRWWAENDLAWQSLATLPFEQGKRILAKFETALDTAAIYRVSGEDEKAAELLMGTLREFIETKVPR